MAPQERGPADLATVNANVYAEDEFNFKAPRILVTKARGHTCFDVHFYRTHNPELTSVNTVASAWKHFTFFGQFERRPYR